MTNRSRQRRFLVAAQMVARIYTGYKGVQALAKIAGWDAVDTLLRRQHRRSAELVYATAAQMQGLLIKACQFVGTRADVLPDEYVEEINRDLPPVLRANPIVEAPSDLLLVVRVMGLLSGIGKQLNSQVIPMALLMPFVAGRRSDLEAAPQT